MIERKTRQRVKLKLGVESIKLNLRGNNGWLDVQFFIPGGKPFIIEFKRPWIGILSELQKHRIEQLEEWGYDVEVHDDAEVAYEAVRRRVDTALEAKRGDSVAAQTPRRRRVR